MTDVDEIWSKLKNSYGDQKQLLTKKLQEVNQVEISAKNRDSVEVLSKIVNLVKDLMRLAKRHSIENNLYYGEGLNQEFQEIRSKYERNILRNITQTSNKYEKYVKTNQKLLKTKFKQKSIQ